MFGVGVGGSYSIGEQHTVSFHDFKSQNFKLSVSNPKSKYVAYVSVLSQISNCQGLGRKNKHENLKTDRVHIPTLNVSKLGCLIVIPVCEKMNPFVRAPALQSSRRNFSPSNDLVL